MTPAEPFIGILEEKRLVPDAVIAGLRKQVAESIVPVSAGALAKRLVDRGLLTPFQAQQVLDQAAGRHRQSAQEEIGLAEEPRPAGADRAGRGSRGAGASDRRRAAPCGESLGRQADCRQRRADFGRGAAEVDCGSDAGQGGAGPG